MTRSANQAQLQG